MMDQSSLKISLWLLAILLFSPALSEQDVKLSPTNIPATNSSADFEEDVERKSTAVRSFCGRGNGIPGCNCEGSIVRCNCEDSDLPTDVSPTNAKFQSLSKQIIVTYFFSFFQKGLNFARITVDKTIKTIRIKNCQFIELKSNMLTLEELSIKSAMELLIEG